MMDLFQESNGAPVYLVNDHQHYDDQGAGTDSDTFISEVSSDRTMSTLSSQEAANYFLELHGFAYTTDKNLPLIYPTDSLCERLHVILNMIIRLCQKGKNVPPPAEELLQSGGLDGRGARVLDLVTKGGVWAHEMADTYPQAEFVSLDVKPLVALIPHARIRFEVYDLYAGIAEPDASFDIVHVRQCVALTKDWNFLLREMHRVLKPGGLLVIGEIPPQSYEANDPSMVLHSSPRRVEAIKLLRAVHASQGIDIDAWDDMSARLEPTHPHWFSDSHSTTHGFRDISLQTHIIPNGPQTTDQDQEQRAIGTLSKVLFENVWKMLLPMLQITGMAKSDAQAFVDRLLEEVGDARYRSCAKYKVWYARKI